MLISLQPLPAIVGFVGCLVVFAFCSATWWYTKATAEKVFIAYAAQVIVVTIFLVLKAIRYFRTGTFKSQRIDRGSFAGYLERLNDLQRHVKKSSTNTTTPSDQSSTRSTTTRDQAMGYELDENLVSNRRE
jgi:amino acid transporter